MLLILYMWFAQARPEAFILVLATLALFVSSFSNVLLVCTVSLCQDLLPHITSDRSLLLLPTKYLKYCLSKRACFSTEVKILAGFEAHICRQSY